MGAYAALAIPGVVAEPAQMVGALGPVAALTLAAHLGRRDLPRALRDWALVMGLGVYAALGFVAKARPTVALCGTRRGRRLVASGRTPLRARGRYAAFGNLPPARCEPAGSNKRS